MFDSVREELQTKITSGRLKPQPQPDVMPKVSAAIEAVTPSMPVVPSLTAAPVISARTASSATVPTSPRPEKRLETADLVAPKTSPTLLGFESKNPTLPDWRIQLQNAVKQRRGTNADAGAPEMAVATPVAVPAVAAAAARRPSPTQFAGAAVAARDPRVEKAMQRIDASRVAFAAKPKPNLARPTPPPAKPFKFDVVPTPRENAVAKPAPAVRMDIPEPSQKVATPALKVVAPPPVVKRDTNKLPPITVRSTTIDRPTVDEAIAEATIHTTSPQEFREVNRIRIKAEVAEQEILETTNEHDDIEDLAQLSSRFGSGLFDLIITGFASLLVLSPFALSRGDWFTTYGMLTFAGVFAIITFFYMTFCLGLYGKTFGMRLFSLELVDAVENEYPTLHQAAVSSSVFLLSLVAGGAGFATMIFNSEKRAAHDLASGTILVREF